MRRVRTEIRGNPSVNRIKGTTETRNMSANHYSQRMLNPFHGIVNVVEIDGADAVSRDGVHWALYIQGEVDLEALEDGSTCRIPLPDIKYGAWSLAGGLKRAPVRYVVDYAWVDALGSWLLEEVKLSADAVPFPLRDRYELWLLDHLQGMPLALLDSACSSDTLSEIASAKWEPGQLAGQEFRAPSRALDEGRRMASLTASCWPKSCAKQPARRGDPNGFAAIARGGERRLAQTRKRRTATPGHILRTHSRGCCCGNTGRTNETGCWCGTSSPGRRLGC